MSYVKKPVVIEAYHLKREEEPKWYKEAKKNRIVIEADGGVYIKTLEGTHFGNDGCYVIQGVHGELYPCVEDIFEETYEEVK